MPAHAENIGTAVRWICAVTEAAVLRQQRHAPLGIPLNGSGMPLDHSFSTNGWTAGHAKAPTPTRGGVKRLG